MRQTRAGVRADRRASTGKTDASPLSSDVDTMIYHIPVEWTAIGHMDIEANSLQEAVDHACGEEPLPVEWLYLEDSFRVDVVGLRETHPEEEAEVPERCV